MSPERELQLHRLLARMRAKLSRSRDPQQLARAALRSVKDFYDADEACLARRPRHDKPLRFDFRLPASSEWDLDLLAAFHEGQRPDTPDDVLLAPIRRRRRVWQVMALRTQGTSFPESERIALFEIARTISEMVLQIDQDRIAEVRGRIDRKIMEQLRPKDLFYQILDGLRTLTRYDHSAALLIAVDDGAGLELVAEQIAWRKGKSTRVGRVIDVPPRVRTLMSAGGIHGFSRSEDGWRSWTGGAATELATLLADGDDERGEVEMLCAPLPAPNGFLGVLKVASRSPGVLGTYEAELVRRFRAQVSVAIQNAHRAEGLHSQVVEAEKRNALADLARGVAHDVNNALGSVLPLVQQLREDAGNGQVEADLLHADLTTIEDGVQLCRRIFSGMLDFAAVRATSSGDADLCQATRRTLNILKNGLDRRGIAYEVTIPDNLPPIPGNQGDLEQVLLNLLTNARDAMPDGGKLSLTAVPSSAHIETVIEDDGAGIEPKVLERMHEPFFTTKPRGTGLGLAICRSIVWGMRGKMSIKSTVGKGTRVQLSLPTRTAVEPDGGPD